MITRLKHINTSGNVLFILLIGIALFAGLTVAVTQSGKNVGGATKEKASLAATEIMEYANSVKAAVQRLTFNGCADTDISFENDTVSGYEHSPVARDKCKVFKSTGGKVRWKTPDPKWMETAYVARSFYFPQGACVLNVGTNGPDASSANAFCDNDPDANELIIALVGIKKEVCEAINLRINGSKIIPIDLYNHNPTNTVFTGVFDDDNAYEYSDGLTGILNGQMSYCFQGSSSANFDPDAYVFYNVLKAR